MNRLFLFTAVILVAAGCQTEPGWVPSPDEPRSFVSTLGTDTVTVEVFVKDGNIVEGILVERTPVTHIIEYRAQLNDDGYIVSLSSSRRTPSTNPDGPPSSGAAITIDGDQATVVREGGRNPGESTLTVPTGVIPTLGRASSSMFIFEQVASQLSDGSDGVMLLASSGADARQNNSIRISADSLSMDYFGSPRIGWTDDQGQILGASGALTTGKAEVRRVEPFLTGAYADRWAAMDAAGTGIGTPSPGATTEATVDGVDFEVRYSQPAKRGREIWGGLVPNGEVWRTGANAATHFSTSADISIGGNELDAGTYTLWSLWDGGEYSLIVNEQTNIWGTAHDGAHDLFSVVMTESDLSDMVERFTISIEDTDEGGIIVLEWDTTRYELALTTQ